jgi:hypothetical protein
MSAAFKAPLPTTQKFVLVALCDSANDQGECYPSVSTLAEKCSLSERAVQLAIASIEAAGGLRREFRVGRSTTYWVTPATVNPRTTFTPAAGSPPNHVHPTPEPDSPPPPNHVHPTPEPRSPITINEPSVEPKTKTKSAVALVPAVVSVTDLVDAGFSEEGAAEFIAHKRAVKAPLTVRAWADHLGESRKAGWSPVDAAEKVMARNWKGFDAKYVASEARPGFERPAETPYQRSMREKYEKVAPQVAARPPNHRAKPVIFDFEVEDVTPRRLG